ncbi:hypothetical protein H6P81_019319 [Aristolochia fimbriata]|uniref:Uncharacterized protein n=1 Tax=Aristolochia fimbriata TaxID=158543 RepID=A0AAV7DS95_ARIFI|nr:hypothetical protein H6P81_019319 [Aristolochia fimbriata]
MELERMMMMNKKKKKLCSILAIIALLFAGRSEAVVETRGRSSPCNGSIADCYAEAEFLIDSEINRRFLQGESKYLTYKGLDKDRPAGGNAQPGQPYNRGCKKTYGCRQGSS